MTTDKYFDPPARVYVPPRIRAWNSFRSEEGVKSIQAEVIRSMEGFHYGPATLAVSFLREDGSVAHYDECDWDPNLDEWLLQHGTRAPTQDQEKERLSLHVRARVNKALVRYGDGIFNSVLIQTIAIGPYKDHPEISAVLEEIGHRARPIEGEELEDCQELIDLALTKIAQSLLGLYDADLAQAQEIFAGAIARYLDERFSVSARRRSDRQPLASHAGSR
jgi:hypothetical protein